MNISKRIAIAILATLGCISAHAVGPYDGIYLCSMTFLGNPSSTYITVNTSGGLGVFAVPYLSSDQPWQGYGIGEWSGPVLSGTTNFGGAFSAEVGDRSIAFVVNVNYYGTYYEATGFCNQII
jgi:hypothetical protein